MRQSKKKLDVMKVKQNIQSGNSLRYREVQRSVKISEKMSDIVT